MPIAFRRWCMASGVLLTQFAITTAASRQPPQPPRFSSTVDLVSVDVTVVDANGHPVRELTPADFVLKVDGKIRTIASAQFVSLTAPAVEDTPKLPADAEPEYTSNVGGSPGRLLAVVVDRGSIAPVRSKDVFTAASHFIDLLQPSDRVALFSIPDGPALDFTTNHDAIVAALQQIDGKAHAASAVKHVGVAEALGFERGDSLTIQTVMQRECGVTVLDRTGGGANGESAICVRQVQDEANTVAAYAHERARDTINGLRTILDRLGASDTPKTIVLISEGLVIDNERLVANGLGHMLAAAHATIYAVAPEPSESDASQSRVPQSMIQDRTARETGLSLVTRLGGGELFRVIANPDASFKRLATELSGYYLLGFEPQSSDRDGKPHTISVEVRKPDLLVRSRAEFTVGGTATANTQRVVADLLRSPAVATGVPFKLTTYAFQDPDSTKIRLLVAMEVARADARGQLALGLVMITPDGETAQTFYQPSIDAPKGGGPQTCFATLLVDPGSYRLKAAVVDAAGRQGSLERHVRAYMTRMARFRATDLLIGDDAQPSGNGGTVVPTVSGNMSGAELHAYMELFSDTADAFAGTSVALEVLPAGGSTPVGSAPATLQPIGADPRVRAVTGAVRIALLPHGPYVARAVVSVNGQKVGEMRRAFRY